MVLSHGNILNNVHQMRHHLVLDPLDVVALGILPFFHSFGYTVGIWTILLLGKKAVYHTNPLDAKVIGDLCEKHRVTLLAASPTFARHYIQRKPEQYATLVPPAPGRREAPARTRRRRSARRSTSSRWKGTGRPRCRRWRRSTSRSRSPLPDGGKVVAGQPAGDRRPPPARHERSRRSTPRPAPTSPGGRGDDPGPGAADHEGVPRRPRGDGQGPPGRLVRDSGDLGYLDPDGFLRITGRLSRFAKIAGEMVPHLGVESALMEAAGVDEMALAVTAVPDDKRGENAWWWSTPSCPSRRPRSSRSSSPPACPSSAIPAAEDFIQVEAVPRLGTGGRARSTRCDQAAQGTDRARKADGSIHGWVHKIRVIPVFARAGADLDLSLHRDWIRRSLSGGVSLSVGPPPLGRLPGAPRGIEVRQDR